MIHIMQVYMNTDTFTKHNTTIQYIMLKNV